MSGPEEDFVIVTLPRRLGNMRLSKAMTRTNGKDPLLLLPEEVWRVVLDELEDWRDIRNCSNTCSLFRRLVQDSKTLNQFKIYALFGKVLPHLYKYLNGREMLRCRAVCTTWNKGVDSFFENDKCLRPHSDMDSDPRRPQYVSLLKEKGLGGLCNRSGNCCNSSCHPEYWIWEIMLRNEDRKYVASHDGNPFIGRDVIVSGDCSYLEAACLEAYGKHIWYLTVSFSRHVDTPHGFRLLSMVTVEQDRFFPNLRRLCIDASEEFRWEGRCPIDLGSTPVAPHLETLQIKGLHDIKAVPTLVESLLRKCHLQLGRLDVWLDDQLPLVSRLEWPNLTELRVEGRYPYGGIRDYELLLRTKMPNLSKLALDQLSVETSWSELVELIGKLSLSTRLTTLRISALVKSPPGGSKSNEDSFAAPETLKTLELGNRVFESEPGFVHFTSYSFLRRFPFLENLNICWRLEEVDDNILLTGKEDWEWKRALQDAEFLDDDDGLEVTKYLYRGEMYKFNIWEVLPRLKVLTFQMKCYTRDGYHKFRMMEQD